MSAPDPIDGLLHDALVTASAGLDLDLVHEAITDALRAVRAQAAVLAGADYAARTVTLKCPGCERRQEYSVPSKPEDVARAMAHSGKVLDEIVRLAAFAKGQPDSRPDRGNDVLALLSPEELRVVEGWIAAKAARAAAETPV